MGPAFDSRLTQYTNLLFCLASIFSSFFAAMFTVAYSNRRGRRKGLPLHSFGANALVQDLVFLVSWVLSSTVDFNSIRVFLSS
ncbi:hypothetical protein QBC39DRAFT_734 [Podospora conica]|nr:hypothetical protein QBC39DRAFT_734 [Schizothecium conicum]